MNSGHKPAEVGNRPEGSSWVGAQDLAGNMWEWVSTIFGIDNGDYNFDDAGETVYSYPYAADDGREQDSSDITYIRILRGGAWDLDNPTFLRAPNRYTSSPDMWYSDHGFGFRCVRPFVSLDIGERG